MKITALVPCRAGSERVKSKNTKQFGDSSLLEIKLNQLLRTKNLDKIILSTDDEEVLKIAKKFANSKKIVVHRRQKYFASSECSNQEMIEYFINNLEYEHLLWTHVTSPFLDDLIYEKAINKYKKILASGSYDSLMTVQKCNEPIWNKNLEVISHSTKKMGYWPKTQTVDPLYICNSGIFLVEKKLAIKLKNRIGVKPYYLETSLIESIDIDWPDDFKNAEKIWKGLRE